VESDKFFRGDSNTAHRPNKIFRIYFCHNVCRSRAKALTLTNRSPVADWDQKMAWLFGLPERDRSSNQAAIGIWDRQWVKKLTKGLKANQMANRLDSFV
jgi:hypothetical protein